MQFKYQGSNDEPVVRQKLCLSFAPSNEADTNCGNSKHLKDDGCGNDAVRIIVGHVVGEGYAKVSMKEDEQILLAD